MLTEHAGTSTKHITFRDRFNYVLDQDNATPGEKNSFSSCANILVFICIWTGFITRDQGERVFKRLNRYKESVFVICLSLLI